MEGNQCTNRRQTLALSTEQAGGAGRDEGLRVDRLRGWVELEIGSHDPASGPGRTH
jgi:hypothetical protein